MPLPDFETLSPVEESKGPDFESLSEVIPEPSAAEKQRASLEGLSPTQILARSKMAYAPQVGRTMREGPLFPIPRVSADSPAFRAVLRGITGQEPTDEMATSAAAAVNVGKSLPEFLESPMGIVTAPAGGGALGPLASRLTALGFAGQMAAGVPEAAREAGRVSVEGTPQEQKEALLGLGANIALPAALAAPALARRGLVRPAPEEMRPVATPVAPEAAPVAPAPAPTPLTAAEQAAERARLASELGEEPEPAAAAPTPAPRPAPVLQAPVEVAAPAKPEVANLGDPSTKPNRFGDPAGTTYYATPEDWQAWQEHDARFKKISKDFIEAMRGGDPEKIAEAQKAQLEVGKEHEAFREKYGGMNPEPPKALAAEPEAAAPTYTGADAIEIVGKPLGEWFKAKTAADLPKGAQRVELAGRIRAKSTKPKDILGALKNEQDRIRRVVTEMAKPPLSPEEAIPMVSPVDVGKELIPGVPITSKEGLLDALAKDAGGQIDEGRKFALSAYYTSEGISKALGAKPGAAGLLVKTGLLKKTPEGYALNLDEYSDAIEDLRRRGFLPRVSPETKVIPESATATETTPTVPAAEMPKTPTEHSTDLPEAKGATVPTKSVKPVILAPKGKVPPNSAVIEVVDYNGKMHAKVVLPHDGTPEGAIEAAKKLRAYADQNFEWKNELYHTNTRYGATDASGNLKWVISPNDANIAEVGTPQARYILGDLSAMPGKVGTAPPALPEPQAPPTETPTPTPEVGHGPIGMGGAAAGEIQATGPRGEPIHGIAARVLEQRRQQGVIAPVEPGEGISPQESIERGRQLLAQGVNPEKVLEDFNLTKAVSAEGIAVVRAQGERLARTAYAMADAHGIHSPEYEAAWEADSDWAKRTKPMQTEWHKIGQAQQGETEIDTGTFHGLRKAFLDATGKDFTPKQAKEAEGIAKGVKEATEAADKAKADVFAEVGKQAKTTPETKPAAPKPGEIATPDATTLWKRAKAIIDAGEDDFDALRHKLATEFGVPVEEVTRKLAEPKSAKKITDDMYHKMAEQRRMVNQAKSWLKSQEMPGWLRVGRQIPSLFFKAAIFGHGTVGMITHAGLNMFNPVAWRTYWPNFIEQYKLFWSGIRPGAKRGVYHERMMQDLLRDPLFTKARRAGLANDPFIYHDDYQTPSLIKWLDRMGLTGGQGFDALKLFRQARFNQIWNDLPGTLQTPEYAKLLADSVNHATGVVRRPFREWANWTFFAPKLEASRWAWMVKDPWDAAKTFVDWNKASSAEKAFAMSQLKEKAMIAGTYYSLLMMNQGLLQASGSDQRINFTNPRRGDFLAFKAAGHNIGIISPMLGMVRLFANLYHAAAGKRGKVESLTPRAGEMIEKGGEYARGKLSPFMGFGWDVVSQADFQGRPMPYSEDAVPKYLRRQGLDRYTYGEYAAQRFSPIPASEAVKEVWHAQGMGEDAQDYWLKVLAVGLTAASTGARVSAETPPTNP